MKPCSFRRHSVLTLLTLLAVSSSASAQSAENVLLVVNELSPASVEIGQHYERTRAIPAENVVRIRVEASDDITMADFQRDIEAPLAAWFSRSSAHDRVLYIVLTKGLPLRITGTLGRAGTVASVDSELTLLYRKLTGRAVAPEGPSPNPYFLGDRPVDEAKRFSHERHDIFLVSRLDGFTVDDVLSLIDRGAAPSPHGRIVLDQKAAWQDKGNEWLAAAADLLTATSFGDRVMLESTSHVVTDETGLLGYYSWGSNDPAIRMRRLSLGFVPGALAAMFVSTDARTFQEPPEEWQIGVWEDPNTYFAGSPQSLAGDLIREGVTGTAASVAEPYLDGAIRPTILFPAYLSGFNLIESFYLAMPYLSWQTVVVGDPLCAPFTRQDLTAEQIDTGLDPVTELPVFFSGRRLEFEEDKGLQPEAVRLMLRAETRLTRLDEPAARQALEDATHLDSRLNRAHLLLASLHEQAGEHDEAGERYRRVLANTPNDRVALNNLAYHLAVRSNQPAEALPLARRAYALGRGDPSITDTLGWIQHLLGNEGEASRLLVAAATNLPDGPAAAEIRLHLAVVYAAVGHYEASLRELTRAVELDPDLEMLEEVTALRATLSEGARLPE